MIKWHWNNIMEKYLTSNITVRELTQLMQCILCFLISLAHVVSSFLLNTHTRDVLTFVLHRLLLMKILSGPPQILIRVSDTLLQNVSLQRRYIRNKTWRWFHVALWTRMNSDDVLRPGNPLPGGTTRSLTLFHCNLKFANNLCPTLGYGIMRSLLTRIIR